MSSHEALVSPGGENLSISVVIPVHNGEATLLEQLYALESQRAAHGAALLIVDNGSTDNTADVAKRFALDHADASVVSAPDRPGAGYARNVGVAETDADLVLFCDADDVVGPGWIQAHLSTLTANHVSVGVVRTWDGELPASFEGSWPEGVPSFGKYRRVTSCNLGLRRSALVSVAGFDERFLTGQDVELGIRLQDAGYAVVATPAARVLRRVPQRAHRRFRRAVQYGRGRRMIRRTHSEFPPLRLGREVWFLGSRAPLALVSSNHRTAWVRRLGIVVGYAWGPFRRGTRHLRH